MLDGPGEHGLGNEELGGGLGKALLADYLYKVLQLLDLHTYPSISLHLFHKNGGNSFSPWANVVMSPILPESAKIFQEKNSQRRQWFFEETLQNYAMEI